MMQTMTDDATNVAMNASPGLPSPSTFNPTVKPRQPFAPPTGAAPGATQPTPLQAVSMTASIPGATGGTAPSLNTMPGSQATQLPSPSSVAPPAVLPPSALPVTNPGGAGTANAPGAAGASPNPGGAVPTTPIDPTNDLRSSAVLPTSSPQLDQARNTLATTTGAVTGYDRNADVAGIRNNLAQYFGPTDVTAGAGVGTAPSARLSNYNTLLDSSAGNLAGVDRIALAQKALAAFDDSQLPEHQLALNNLTKQYVARGGGRSGMVRTAYGDEDLARQRDRDTMKKQLINSAIEGTIQDQFNKTNTLSGLQGTTAAQDAAQRGEQRTERAYGTDVATGNVERGLSAKLAANAGANSAADANSSAKTAAIGAAQNQFDTLNQEGQANRNETRGERAYQGSQENQSYTRGMTQLEQEQAQKTNELNRELATLSAGDAGNPASTLTSLANGSPGLDPQLIASLGQSLGKQANNTPTALDAILEQLKKTGGLPVGAPQATTVPTTGVPPVAGNEPDYQY